MPDIEARRATLRDVAAAAGVSYQTVSRVVNQKPSVAPGTRERVLDVIRQLNFTPNPAAQVLNTGRSHILQLVIFTSVYGRAVSAMVQEGHQLGYTLAITELGEPASIKALRERLEATARMADGLLLMLPYEGLSPDDLFELCDGRPFVVVGSEMGTQVSSVVFDQRHAIDQVVDHLLSLGHRGIVEIAGGLDHAEARARHQALAACLALRGMRLAASLEADPQAASAFTAVERLLSADLQFTALLVGNDRMALGALRALRERGLRVPEDVSIVGFEDVQESAFYEPPLTTVRQDFYAFGRQCVKDLVAHIEVPDTQVTTHVLYPELVVRQSTALCRCTEPARAQS